LIKPNCWIDRAICLICFLEWVRAFALIGPQGLRRDVFHLQITHDVTYVG
jgi:hypothetical protein